jgi:hypothetical protein
MQRLEPQRVPRFAGIHALPPLLQLNYSCPALGHVSLRQVLLGVSSAFFASMLLRLNCSRSIGDIANN